MQKNPDGTTVKFKHYYNNEISGELEKVCVLSTPKCRDYMTVLCHQTYKLHTKDAKQAKANEKKASFAFDASSHDY